MIGKWHCSFDELVSKHTSGQIMLLVSGMAEWEEYQASRIPNPEKTAEPKQSRPDFKKMTGEDYMRQMDRMGVF